jgi:hypothetical protein
VPPGHGATPPGQGGTPPGQAQPPRRDRDQNVETPTAPQPGKRLPPGVTPPIRNPEVPRSSPGEGPRTGTPAPPPARAKTDKEKEKEKKDAEDKAERNRNPQNR